MNRNPVAVCTRCVQTAARATKSRAHVESATCRPPPTYNHAIIRNYTSARRLRNDVNLLKACATSYPSIERQSISRRSFATAHVVSSPQRSDGQGEGGPIQEYDRRVEADLLRDDAHQRSKLRVMKSRIVFGIALY